MQIALCISPFIMSRADRSVRLSSSSLFGTGFAIDLEPEQTGLKRVKDRLIAENERGWFELPHL